MKPTVITDLWCLADEISVDILINNAGISTSTFVKTEDGYENTLAVNYLGEISQHEHRLFYQFPNGSTGADPGRVWGRSYMVGTLRHASLHIDMVGTLIPNTCIHFHDRIVTSF